MERITYSMDEGQEVYKAMIAALPQSMFLLDKNKNIIGIFNASLEILAGLKAENIVGSNVMVYANDLNSPFYQACSMLNSTFDPVFRTGVPLKFQFMILDTYLEATVTKISGDKILSQVCDISNIVLLQQEIERKKHRELEMALTAGGLTSWEYDARTGLLSSQLENSVIEEGMPQEELLFRIDVEYRQETRNLFDDILLRGKKYAHITVPVLDRIGRKQWADVHAIPYEYAEDGSVITIIGSQKDVTKEHEDHKRLCELIVQNEQTMMELSLSKKKAEQSDLLKSAFLANMSHEIRTPLNSIVGFAQLIPEAEGEEQQKYIELVNSNSDVLLRLISDILDLSKIEAGYFTCSNTMFNLSDLFSELEMSFHFKKLNKVDLYCQLPQKAIYVNLDRVRISQIIANFVTNAMKFTKEGHICMGYDVVEDFVRIFVEDTGVGMSEKEMKRVFERFEKFNNFEPGTGLGTSIAKAIAEAYGGNIGVQSTLGVGSTFWAMIPMNMGADTTIISDIIISNEVAPLEMKPSEEKTKRLIEKFLVAEDNESNFLLIKALLKGYLLTRAYNGKEAVDKVRSESFDMVLMDIQMPVMNGLDAILNIREFNKKIPIVAITATAFDEDRRRAFDAGANDYLTKPLNKAKLLEVIARC